MNVKRLRLALLVFVCAGTLSGCATMEGIAGLDLLTEPGKGLGGAEPVMEEDKFQKIDLLSELCSDTSDAQDASACDPGTGKEYTSEEYAQQLARAFANFNTRPDNAGNKRRRNGIQERILASSDKLCGDYKMLLRQQQASYNFMVGSGATVLGGLGAIFTHVNTVRALSGAAAILSGVRAGYNENYFADLQAHALTKAIHEKRKELYTGIRRRQGRNLERYPIQAAIRDAIEYHAACSNVAGMEEIVTALEIKGNPGIKQIYKIFDPQQHDSELARNGLNFTMRDGSVSIGKIRQPLGLVVSREKVTVLRGSTMTYTVSLNTAPADTVTVKLDIVPQVPDVYLDPASMIFTTENWDIDQTVTITATDNPTTLRTGTDNGTIVHHDPDNNSFAGKTIRLEVKPPSIPTQ